MPESAKDASDVQRESTEQAEIGHLPHFEGITRGTMLQYDGWQWAVVTKVADKHDPPMFGFVLLDELGDDVVALLEPAWGCWEHYDVVKAYRGSEHEYWTSIEYVLENEVWEALGPIHPDERTLDSEVEASA